MLGLALNRESVLNKLLSSFLPYLPCAVSSNCSFGSLRCGFQHPHFTLHSASHFTLDTSLSLSLGGTIQAPKPKTWPGDLSQNSMNFVGAIGMIKVASSRCYITTYSDSRGYSLTQYVYIYIIVTHSMYSIMYNLL